MVERPTHTQQRTRKKHPRAKNIFKKFTVKEEQIDRTETKEKRMMLFVLRLKIDLEVFS